MAAPVGFRKAADAAVWRCHYPPYEKFAETINRHWDGHRFLLRLAELERS